MKTSNAVKRAGRSAAGSDTRTNERLLALVRLEPPQTREALVELCQATTRLSIERDAAQLKLDARVLALQEAHAPMIDKMNGEIDRSVKLMQLWALEHREAEFEGRQGIEVAGCVLEFRKGTGRVVADDDEKTSLNRLLSLPDAYEEQQRSLMRLTCTLNKQAVIALAKSAEGAAFLETLGLRIVVDEEFRFTPAREDLTPMTTHVKAAA